MNATYKILLFILTVLYKMDNIPVASFSMLKDFSKLSIALLISCCCPRGDSVDAES